MPPEDSPFFSVIIPTYNRAEKLRQALESVARQTYRDFEVIVCDDGSVDHTAKVVASFAERMAVRHLWEENWGGPARPRNNGLKAARGEWVCFLDADDWWYPRKLEKVRAVLATCDIVSHACHMYGPKGRRFFAMTGRQPHEPVFVDLMTGWNAMLNSATCVRRSVVAQSGGFLEERSLVAIEDFDLWLRISRLTERFRYIPEVLGAYRVDDSNISTFSEVSAKRETELFERHAGYLSPVYRSLAERMLAYRLGLIYWFCGDRRKSRKMFMAARGCARFRHRLLVYPWILATFLCPSRRSIRG